MLTGNEPISAGNLKAALGGYGRPLSAYIASGQADGNQIKLTGGGGLKTSSANRGLLNA